MFPYLVDGHNVWVVEVCNILRLQAETPDLLRRGELAGKDHLQGNDTVERHLPGAVDHPHASTSNFFEQLIVAEVSHSVRRPVGRGHLARGDGWDIVEGRSGGRN